MRPPGNQRRQHRHALPLGAAATAEFDYPGPGGRSCVMPLRDLSASGLSMVLTHELPGLEPGAGLACVTVRIGNRSLRADLLVMHLTPAPKKGAVCGALLYPLEDADLLTLRELVAELEGWPATAPSADTRR